MNKKQTSNVVPKLNLEKNAFSSKSAPNSARSNHSETSTKNPVVLKDEKYLAWKRRKEYQPTRPASANRPKAPLKMTKSLTFSSRTSVALKEDEIINHRVLVAQPQPQTPEKELTVLDELVIDTSLNISDKICTSAINVMLLATKKFSVVDEDILLNVETLSYILEDSHIQTDEKEKQLSALLKNMKKLEHALALTDRILNNTETTKQ